MRIKTESLRNLVEIYHRVNDAVEAFGESVDWIRRFDIERLRDHIHEVADELRSEREFVVMLMEAGIGAEDEQ